MTVGLHAPAAPDGVGFVSLVGAGPGDPELLTLKAARRLAEADLLLYDGLVPTAITAVATRAQHFCVSKRAGRPSVDQETIQQVMIRGAQRGKRVVRLKNGDPFLLGRGGEEALALRAAGIPFEVVPGITAAIAAPALAGIPVTQRGVVAGFTVVSGHAAAAFEPILDAVEPGSMTVIVLMGLRNRGHIAATLLQRGWPPHTPAAIVLAASTPRMRVWSGRLDELGIAPVDVSDGAPGTIVVGDVANLSTLVGGTRAPVVTADAVASPAPPPGSARGQARNV